MSEYWATVGKNEVDNVPDWAEHFEVGDNILWKVGDKYGVSEIIGFSTEWLGCPVILPPDHEERDDHVQTLVVTKDGWAGTELQEEA